MWWPLAFFLLQEFVVQHSENANPPTFFLTMETLLQRMQKEDKMVRLSVAHRISLSVCRELFVLDHDLENDPW